MGRFETLKPETQDMVEAMLPAVASSFKIDLANFKDIIPKDIRMRQWDCDRRDHIKDKPEDEPRNWGVEFLKCLQAIARITGGNLALFQERVYEKVEKHAEKHPWARLEDIRIVKAEFEKPSLRDPAAPDPESSSDDSLDSYLEELVDRDLPHGARRGQNEDYESRVQGWWKPAQVKKPKKPVRLRRDEDGGYQRRGKNKNKRTNRDMSPLQEGSRRSSSVRKNTPLHDNKRRRLVSKRSSTTRDPTPDLNEEDFDDEDLEAQVALAELEAAEAELEFKRAQEKAHNVLNNAKRIKAARAASVSSAGRSNSNFRGFTDARGSRELSGFEMNNGASGFSNLSGFNDRTDFKGFSGFDEPNSTTQFNGFEDFNDHNGFDSVENDDHHSSSPVQQDGPVGRELEGTAQVEQDDDEEYSDDGEDDGEDDDDDEDEDDEEEKGEESDEYDDDEED